MYILLNKSSSMNQLPRRLPTRSPMFDSFEARSSRTLSWSAITIAGFMSATFYTPPASRAGFYYSASTSTGLVFGVCDTRDTIQDKGTPRRPTTDTEIGIWTRPLSGSRGRKKTGRNRCYPTTSTGPDHDPFRWDNKKRESFRLRGIPRRVLKPGGYSYTDNLKAVRSDSILGKITCAVYYAFPCNGSIIRFFVTDHRTAIIRSLCFSLSRLFFEIKTNRIKNRAYLNTFSKRMRILLFIYKELHKDYFAALNIKIFSHLAIL